MNAIEANINEIKLMINNQQQNEYKNNDEDIDTIEFKYWLKTDVGLYQEYYQLFIKNGIDSLSTIKLLKEKELKEIGIDIIGHRVKLLHAISVLKELNDLKDPQ